MLKTTLRAGLATLAVAVSVSLVAPSAWAAPTPTATPSATATAEPSASPKAEKAAAASYTYTTTGTLGEKTLRISLVMQHSAKKKDRHLDWSAAKKYFDKHTTWRDDFAAGYQGAGGTLDNAAKSTKDRLKKRWEDAQDAARKAARKNPLGTNCTGTSKDVAYSKDTGRSEVWLDSCDTNFQIGEYLSCSTIMGGVTARVKGWWSLIPAYIGTSCVLKGAQLGVAKSNSSVGAVKIYYTRVARVGGNGMVDGQVYISYSVHSQ